MKNPRPLTVPPALAWVVGLVASVATGWLVQHSGQQWDLAFVDPVSLGVALIVIVVLVPAHELLHGLGYLLGGASLSRRPGVRTGFWKYPMVDSVDVTLWRNRSECRHPMSPRAYGLALALPLVLVIPLWGLAAEWPALLLPTVVAAGIAGGDIPALIALLWLRMPSETLLLTPAMPRGWGWRISDRGQPVAEKGPLVGPRNSLEFQPAVVKLPGRGDVVFELAGSQAAVTLLTGDSGIGKSSVLGAAQEISLGLAPPPQTIPASGAKLRRAVLDALGTALAALVADADAEAAEKIGQALLDATNRILDQTFNDLPRVIAAELASVVRGQLGPEFGQAFMTFAQELVKGANPSLASQLLAANDPGVIGLLLDFLHEAAGLAGERPIVLALDIGERLGEDDLESLTELAERMPDGAHLHVAFNSDSQVRKERVAQLVTSTDRVAEIRVRPLDEDGTRVWLARELSAEAADELAAGVHRTTQGFPLHIADLIRHLADGGKVEDAPLNELFAARTREIWQALEPQPAQAARRLVVLRDPPDREEIKSLCELNDSEWGDVEQRLILAGAFNVERDGQPWFHEQRRSLILNEFLANEEKAVAAERAGVSVWNAMAVTGQTDRAAEWFELISIGRPAAVQDGQLAAVLDLTHEELRIFAALIELIDDVDQPVTDGDDLLRYAMRHFGAGPQALEALVSMVDRELLVMRENERTAAVVPRWTSQAIVAAIGRIEVELGRVVVPRAASAIYQLNFETRLAPFSSATYGLGDASFTHLASAVRALDPTFGRPRGVALKGDLGGRPFYLAATFSNDLTRDEAVARLGQPFGAVLEDAFVVEGLEVFPAMPIASRRFLTALNRLTGKSYGHSFTGTSKPSVPLPEEIDHREGFERKLAALALVRANCSPRELRAFNLEEARSFYFAQADATCVELVVVGGDPGVFRIDGPPKPFDQDPFDGFRIVLDFGLEPDQHIERIHAMLGTSGIAVSKDPVGELFGELAQKAYEFNKANDPLVLPFTVEGLQPLLAEAARRRFEDARTLAAVPGYEAFAEELQPRHTLLLLEPSRHIGMPGAIYRSYSSDEEHDTIEIAVVNQDDRRLEDEFEIPAGEALTEGTSAASSFIAGRLGHFDTEIRLDHG